MERIGLVDVGYIGTEFLDRLLPDHEVTVFDIDDRRADRGGCARDGHSRDGGAREPRS